MIELVDKGQNRNAAHPADLEKLLCLSFDAFGAIEHHDCAIRDHESAIGIFAEILVPGRV
jgi:hypothetical protein